MERLGYLIETIREDIVEMRREIQETKDGQTALKEEVQNFKIRGDTTIRIFKWIVGVLTALITLKLGDVKSMFVAVFGK
jgi:hypothetical protein